MNFFIKVKENSEVSGDIEYDFLEDVIVNENKYNLMKYLHGYCDRFALGLANSFGYGIKMMFGYDYELDRDFLVHTFNFVSIKDKMYYIDVRGVTDSLDDIKTDFEDWDEISNMTFYNLDEAKNYLESFLAITYEDEVDIWKEIDMIMEDMKEVYSVC